MLWAVMSSARCSASRPRSAVSTPMKVEIDTLGPRVHGHDRLRRRDPAGRGVAGLRRAGEDAQQVAEEGELLPDQDPVLLMDAADLAEDAAQLGGELARHVPEGG